MRIHTHITFSLAVCPFKTVNFPVSLLDDIISDMPIPSAALITLESMVGYPQLLPLPPSGGQYPLTMKP